MKKMLVSILIACSFSTVVAEQNYPGYPDGLPPGNYAAYHQNYRPQDAQNINSPADLLEQSIEQVIDFISSPEAVDIDQVFEFLNRHIAPHFDFDYMSRQVAGKYLQQLSSEHQEQFKNSFSELFLATLVQTISVYESFPPVIESFMSKRIGNNAVATTKIVKDDGRWVKLEFKFLNTPKGWKVVDVKANGVSAIVYYRNYFAEQLRQLRLSSVNSSS